MSMSAAIATNMTSNARNHSFSVLATVSESEWHAFVVKLTDQADAMSRSLKAPRGGIHIQWRDP